MKTPPYLSPGDTIGIVSPARSIEMKSLRPFISRLAEQDLKVKFGKNLFEKEHQFSGTDSQRSFDLSEQFTDDEIRVIFAARGGYGTGRLLRSLDPELISRHPKWLVGFSDLTALHSWLNRYAGMESLHGLMPFTMSADPEADDENFENLMNVLRGNPVIYSLQDHPLNHPGKVRGILTGGNLSVLYSLAGSDMEPDYEGKILFLEEVDEYLYHIDRMMLNFELRDVCRKIRGLIVGDCTRMQDNETSFGKKAYEIIAERAHKYSIPTLFGFPAGHGKKNCTLILGRESTLTCREGEQSLKMYTT